MSSSLELDGVTVTYDGVTALSDVSLCVDPNEFVALLGSNGAGKSTCLRTIMGGVAPDAGRVLLDGDDITDLPPRDRVRRGLTISPENRELFPNMTVAENLDMGGYALDDQERLAEIRTDVYELFPVLRERRGQLAHTLSGGQQQMTALGRALMGDPDVLLLDEPSLGLAPNLVAETGEFIARFREERELTVLMVEQNVEIPFEHSDRIYLVQNGRIADESSTDTVLASDTVRKSYMGI